jgi:hypothetical protein
MTRHLLTVLALLFLLPDAQAQAPAVRPPARPVVPPALTPGYNPNTPPDPVYTPPGTGLPEVGQPGTHAAPVKRSPNTRALPDEFSPKKEPGIWAADGAPKATMSTELFGYTIPRPKTAEGAEDVLGQCVFTMSVSAKQAGKHAEIMEMTEAMRMCMALRAVAYCADTWRALLSVGKQAGAPMQPGQEETARHTLAHVMALLLKTQECRGQEKDPDINAILDSVKEEFRAGVRQNMKMGRPN